MWLAYLLDTSDIFHFNVIGVMSREFPENTEYNVLQGPKGIRCLFPVKILSLSSKDSATIRVPKSALTERQINPSKLKVLCPGNPSIPSKPGQLVNCQTRSSFTMGLLYYCSLDLTWVCSRISAASRPPLRIIRVVQLLLGQGRGQNGVGGSLGTGLGSEETRRLRKRSSQGTSAVGKLDQSPLSFIWCLSMCLYIQ